MNSKLEMIYNNLFNKNRRRNQEKQLKASNNSSSVQCERMSCPYLPALKFAGKIFQDWFERFCHFCQTLRIATL